MVNIVQWQTGHVMAFKTMVEVLSSILSDVVMEVHRGDEPKQDKNTVTHIANEKTKKKNKKIKDEDKPKEKESDPENNGSIKIVSVDTSQVMIIQMKLYASQFDMFECVPANYDIGINLQTLSKALKPLDTTDTVSFAIDDDDLNNLKITIENTDPNDPHVSTSHVKLIEVDKKKYEVPPVPCDAVVKVKASSFHKICRDMNNISEYIEIKITQKNITYSCVGDALDKSDSYPTGDDVLNLKIKMSDPEKTPIVQGIFELRNIVTFTKCATLCDYIQIYMTNDQPMCIKYTIATLGQIKILLSTVVNDDVEDFNEENEAYEDDEIVYKDKDN